jgi:hypothetical protein
MLSFQYPEQGAPLHKNSDKKSTALTEIRFSGRLEPETRQLKKRHPLQRTTRAAVQLHDCRTSSFQIA